MISGEVFGFVVAGTGVVALVTAIVLARLRLLDDVVVALVGADVLRAIGGWLVVGVLVVAGLFAVNKR